MSKLKAIAIASGGLDSTTMLYHLLAEGYDVDVLSFDYGQRHKKELRYARNTAAQLGLTFDLIDLSGITYLIDNSALTSPPRIDVENAFPDAPDTNPLKNSHWVSDERKVEVPEGHYAEDNMRLTVVPNRNMIMLAIACGVAINRKANTIAAAMHAGDHFIYPDCRPKFFFSLGQAMLDGNEGFHNFEVGSLELTEEEMATLPQEEIEARQKLIRMGFTTTARPLTTPFLQMSKADIVYRAFELAVPIHWTWSCYKGGMNHCGRCGTCVERLEAVDEAIKRIATLNPDEYSELVEKMTSSNPGDRWDQTVYDDTEYWKVVVAERKRIQQFEAGSRAALRKDWEVERVQES